MIVKDSYVSNLNINGKVIQRKFSGKEFSKSEIKTLIHNFQEKYKNKSLTLMLGVNTPFGFRNSKQFSINDEPSLVDDYEWETTNGFVIYGWKSNGAQGGNSDSNDCLFQCIKQICSVYRLPKGLKTDFELKSALGLKPFDKVPIRLIPKVEVLCKININITGEFSYTSSNKYKQTIHLTLNNEHYEVVKDNNKSKSLLKHIPYKEQKLITVKFEEDAIKCYDGNGIFFISHEDYQERRNDFNGDFVYLEDLPLAKTEIVDDYHLFIEECEKLKYLTNGKIDLAKSGYKVSNEAVKCVHFSLLSFDEPEEMTLTEQEWFYRCFKGGLIFCKNNTTLYHGYNYDKKSAYPSMLCSDHFSFPVKKGDFKQLDEFPDVLQYGIYRCVIQPSGDENLDKLFRFNSKHHYTHYDIQLAKKLGFENNLIQDGQANALLYVKDRANGSMYFRQIVHSLFELKSQSKLAKKILNAIWGALCQRNKIKKTTSHEVNLCKGEMLIEIKPIGDELNKISYLKQGKFFKHNYARLGCFLTSAVRKQMAEIIYPVRDKVFKCHTDSILSSIPLDHLLIGDRLGDFVLEKQGKVHIHHSSSKVEFL
jgi:hypothetical protein